MATLWRQRECRRQQPISRCGIGRTIRHCCPRCSRRRRPKFSRPGRSRRRARRRTNRRFSARSTPAQTGSGRGALIHRLLQHLPDLPPAQRALAAARYLARPGHGLTADEQRRIAAETCAVLDLPAAGPLFGPGSIAEAPVTGVVGEAVISGQIDRLAIGETTVSGCRLQDQPAAAGRCRGHAAGLSAPDGRLSRPAAASLPGAQSGLFPALDRGPAADATGRFAARSLCAGGPLSAVRPLDLPVGPY